jgi:hypothetical protein
MICLSAQIAFAGRFDLPKENPQISIQMPDNWQTGLDGDNVTAHPPANSKVMISVFPVSGAKNIEDAFAIAAKQISAIYSDVKIGKLSRQNQAGINFYGGQGEGEKDGFELILAVAAFSPDGKHFFGLGWARDESSSDVYVKEINEALASIQPFKEPPPKAAK